MLKIAVFCGGTGSVALQTGLDQLYGDTIQVDLIVNAYDNGKSTGVCRRVFKNRILGPSDVRKNQLLQFSLQYSQELKDPTSIAARRYRLFELRFSGKDALDYYKTATKKLEESRDLFDDSTWNYLKKLLDYFFYVDDGQDIHIRETVEREKFEDFSLSNIFYASSAALHHDSLEAAADDMAGLLGIKHNVHLISDISLILQAQTRSGTIIEDEGDIVAWDNPEDKIVRVMLLKDGQEYCPAINEGSDSKTHEISRIVSEADIIIFSTGTQWSSLIPSYMHRGFREMIERSKAKKYMIMNNIEDHDAVGVGAEELCDVLSRYINMDQITVVINREAVPSMRTLSKKYNSITKSLSEPGSKKHIPAALVSAFMTDFYSNTLACKHVLFDLDGTLWNELGTDKEKKVGRENLELAQGIIVTGNNYNHVVNVLQQQVPQDKFMEIYFDYGNTYFITRDYKKVSYLTDEYFIGGDLLETIEAMEPFAGKCKLRGGTVLTIKPLENREHWVDLLNQKLQAYNKKLVAKIAGNTSIDITHVDYTKANLIKLILKRNHIPCDQALFVGNELKKGSEVEVNDIGIHTLSVDDVFECNTYLKTKKLSKEMQ